MTSLPESMRACWQDRELRALFLYFAAIAFFVGGPIQVALPVLAAERQPVSLSPANPNQWAWAKQAVRALGMESRLIWADPPKTTTNKQP